MSSTLAKAQIVELFLTCGSWQEAQRIVDRLLELRLIACAELLPIKSKFTWKGSVQESDEIKLIMKSAEHCFVAIEAEVTKLHSYETFVLEAVPVSRISNVAYAWLVKEISQLSTSN